MSAGHAVHVRRRYVAIPNSIARDHRLSYGARGLLVDMLSRPPGWRFAADRMTSEHDGRDAVRARMRELTAAGFVEVRKLRDAGGRMSTLILVTDAPGDFDDDPAELPDDGSPGAGDAGPGPTSGNGANDQVTPETGSPEPVKPALQEDLDLTKTEHEVARERTRERAPAGNPAGPPAPVPVGRPNLDTRDPSAAVPATPEQLERGRQALAEARAAALRAMGARRELVDLEAQQVAHRSWCTDRLNPALFEPPAAEPPRPSRPVRAPRARRRAAASVTA